MKTKKEVKEKIIQLMLQEVPTEEIAKQLNYSIGTIRNIFEELRDEYGVNSKMGIATAYLSHEILKLNESVCHVLQILSISLKPARSLNKMQKGVKLHLPQNPHYKGKSDKVNPPINKNLQ